MAKTGVLWINSSIEKSSCTSPLSDSDLLISATQNHFMGWLQKKLVSIIEGVAAQARRTKALRDLNEIAL